MDERRTLAFLGWTVGGIVGVMFVLNAVALALVQDGSPAASLMVSRAGDQSAAALTAAPATKADRS